MMGKSPITAAQRKWLRAEVRRLYRDPAPNAPVPLQKVSDADILKALEGLIGRGRVILVLGDDGRPLRLEWRQRQHP
jgi:hypothetical protein